MHLDAIRSYALQPIVSVNSQDTYVQVFKEAQDLYCRLANVRDGADLDKNNITLETLAHALAENVVQINHRVKRGQPLTERDLDTELQSTNLQSIHDSFGDVIIEMFIANSAKVVPFKDAFEDKPLIIKEGDTLRSLALAVFRKFDTGNNGQAGWKEFIERMALFDERYKKYKQKLLDQRSY